MKLFIAALHSFKAMHHCTLASCFTISVSTKIIIIVILITRGNTTTTL